ncbi:UNVERIFIED_CONTAM: hypothetical protein Cloal_3587 [Acetivibrio alkalicellulosi]
MVLEEYSINYVGILAVFTFVLLCIGILMFIRHYNNNLNEKGKSKVKKVLLITSILFSLFLIAVVVITFMMQQYIEKQPADMIVSTQRSGMMLIDNYEYYKVNSTYGTKKKITEVEFNDLMELYGEREKYENAKQKIILTDERYNERNITRVFPFKDYIYYTYADFRDVYRVKLNIRTNESEEISLDYAEKDIRDLEGNMIIENYPDVYIGIKQTITNESEYISTKYIDGRIIFIVLDNSPKKTDYKCIYEYIPDTKEIKLLVKFEKTNIRDIAFIK